MNAQATTRLLVVDDEPDLRTLYELTLVREGYDVESAGGVEDAWALLQQQRYQLVITDMRLPDGSGLDLLHRLETSGRPERAIVITAYGSAENAVEALKAGGTYGTDFMHRLPVYTGHRTQRFEGKLLAVIVA